MPHPIMFRDDDLGTGGGAQDRAGIPRGVREDLLGQAGVLRAEDVRHVRRQRQRPTRRASTSSTRYSILVKVDESDRKALEQDTRFFFPAYMGPSGWLGLDFTARKKVDWAEVRELVDASFRLVAPKKLIKLLDEG